MKYIQNLHQHRQPLRLKDYDYSQAGVYFITICTQNHEYLFGEIVEEKMHLNEAGKMIEKWYVELTNKFPDIQCDEHIVMPNHVHFIIHKIDQNKPDQQKMNNPRRGGPACPPNICSRIDILPITNRADTQVRPYDDKNEKLNDEKMSDSILAELFDEKKSKITYRRKKLGITMRNIIFDELLLGKSVKVKEMNSVCVK
jgi:hypothetical protein